MKNDDLVLASNLNIINEQERLIQLRGGMTNELWLHMVAGALVVGSDSAAKLRDALVIDLNSAGIAYNGIFITSVNNNYGVANMGEGSNCKSYYANVKNVKSDWHYRAYLCVPKEAT